MGQLAPRWAGGSKGTRLGAEAVGWRANRMVRVLLLAFGLATASTVLQAQTAPPTQSLQPTQGACTPGSQSIRVCDNDFRSCNDVCAARALDPSSDIAGCTTACCYSLNVCLRMRGCGDRVFNCQ